jgi:sorting nexin-25
LIGASRYIASSTNMTIPRIALLVGSVVLLNAVFPVFSTIRVIITIPLWISFAIVLAFTGLTWSIVRSPPRVSPSYTRRYGLHTLSFTTPSAWSAVLTRTEWEERPSPSFFPPIHLASTEAVKSRLEAIFKHIRDSFIDPWYSRLSPSAAFPNAVEVFMRQALADVIKRSDNVDWPALLVSRIVPLIRDHIHHYRTVEHLSSTSPSAKSALPLPLPAQGHRALSHAAHVPTIFPSTQIEAYFRDLLDKVVHEIVPESDRSPVVLIMAREILLGSVLMPVFEMLCDSDFWNRQIDERGGRYLHEQYVFIAASTDQKETSQQIPFRLGEPS